MTSDFVVDASAIIKSFVDPTGQAQELGERLTAAGLHAPHLVDAEVGDVLRRKSVSGELDEDTALTGVLALESMVDARYPHAGPLVRGAWELRERVRFYDALYVALAARLRLPLLTADARLSRAPDLPCEVEVV